VRLIPGARTAFALALLLIGGGLALALLALATLPLGLGGPDFGYKKLLALLLGLEACGCGLLLWRRLRPLRQ
jgi:hypothetical protein